MKNKVRLVLVSALFSLIATSAMAEDGGLFFIYNQGEQSVQIVRTDGGPMSEPELRRNARHIGYLYDFCVKEIAAQTGIPHAKSIHGYLLAICLNRVNQELYESSNLAKKICHRYTTIAREYALCYAEEKKHAFGR